MVGIHVDTAITTPKNYAAVEALAEQWEGVLEEVGRGSNELAVEKGKNEGKRKAGA